MNIIDKLFKYGFHDTAITSFSFSKNYIDLNFNSGLYELTDNGIEKKLTNSVKVRLYIDDRFFNVDDIVTIRNMKPKYKCIDNQMFIKHYSNKDLDVCNVFYSRFNKTILFECGYEEKIFLFSIENVIDIEYFFEEI